MRKLLLGLVCVSIGCGGGGGGSSDVDFFGGVYIGSLLLVDDTCGDQTNTAFARHTVNQNERQIVLQEGNLTFEGQVKADNTGFVVLRTDIDAASGCRFSYTLDYSNKSDETLTLEENQFFVIRFATRDLCAPCQVGYAGVLTR